MKTNTRKWTLMVGLACRLPAWANSTERSHATVPLNAVVVAVVTAAAAARMSMR